jgi:hypothetical protein
MEIRQEWNEAAWQRLRHALDMAFGGLPPGIPAEPPTVQGYAGPILVSAASQAGDTGQRGAVQGLHRRWKRRGEQSGSFPLRHGLAIFITGPGG